MLEKIEMPQPFGLGVVNRMQALSAGRRKSAPRDKVDPDCQGLPAGIEIHAPHVPGSDNPKGCFKQLILHVRSSASKAECRTMPHPALLDCTVPQAPSRVRFAGLRPPLTAPAGPSLVASSPTQILKEADL
jgi:hypothetical protein